MGAGLAEFLAASARGGLLPWQAEQEAAARYGAGAREVEAAALGSGLMPSRYARNAGTIGLAGQARLHAATVVVAGCGGLGGYLVELLARLGVGAIVAVDPDSFEESNLNRQLLATVSSLGLPKAEAAARRIREINPAVIARPVRAILDSRNAPAILEGADAVADGLDRIESRRDVASACAALGVPFVHAAVAGWYAQATVQAPGSRAVEELYGPREGAGVESDLGNPAFAPALAAAIEAAETCKLLLGLGRGLAGRLLSVDLLAMESAEFPL
ncbi:MAG TPA: HesA/MoeB/ThiF family protein [Spirochaetales bacterium]|nr:HesA/MoeB/ThiF family protein [Spirochaetales bacterium]HRY56174.1 HesA/MoeB/ThiF family protein [Spirochaetia bacterium]HRZ66073.1 HesA/MoeB/ThiF family protein [Spirochaetia bacterium]